LTQDRFLHEAKITSQLQHPGIVPVHELNESAESRQAGDQWLIGLNGSLQSYPGTEAIRNDLIDQAIEHNQRLASEGTNEIDALSNAPVSP